ncbi:lipase member K, putative, partial [Ixodes scapularis]
PVSCSFPFCHVYFALFFFNYVDQFFKLLLSFTRNRILGARLLPQEYLIRGQGYPFEQHDVVTEDDYVIEMHRIPRGRRPCPEPCRREPVFLMTGLLADSASYVMDYPSQSLGFVLADNNYDVWLGNIRGNTYGKRHKYLDPKSRRFWDFSYHEFGVYDAPAQVDYILRRTGRKNLLYVGMSQGTLMFFTMLSERPEYNDKVRVFAGLAPFNNLAHIKVMSLVLVAPYVEGFLKGAYAGGMYEVLPRRFPIVARVRRLCALRAMRGVCSYFGDSFGNLGSRYINQSRLSVYLCHVPAGTSMKNVIHYDQVRSEGRAQKYDYGRRLNRKYYGQPTPPEYRLDTVRTDVGVFWSQGDQFVPPEGVRELVRQLGPWVKKNHFIDDPHYTHVHFVTSVINQRLLYKDLLEFLGRYVS